MSTDKLLLIAFINDWQPLIKLLQSNNIRCMDVTDQATVIAVKNDILSPKFFEELNDTNCVYQSMVNLFETYIKIYHK